MKLMKKLFLVLICVCLISLVFANPINPSIMLEPMQVPLLINLVVTIGVELLVAYLITSDKSKNFLFSVVLGNLSYLFVYLYVYFLIPDLFMFAPISIISNLLIIEVIVVLVEAGVIHLLNKKSYSYRKALGVSVSMNLASFILGFWFYPMIYEVIEFYFPDILVVETPSYFLEEVL